MYERFDDRLRKVMALANQEAQRFNQKYIGTEHVLIGLAKEGTGIGANVIKNLNIDLLKVRLEVEKRIKSGPEMVTMGKLPQTPRTKKAIEYAIEDARAVFNHNYVGTEHLLLGLLREQDGVAAQVLRSLGVEYERACDEIRSLLNERWPLYPLKETSDEFDARPLVLLLDPGTATAEEIGQLLYEFSTLYRMLGGSGITFTATDAREPIIV